MSATTTSPDDPPPRQPPPPPQQPPTIALGNAPVSLNLPPVPQTPAPAQVTPPDLPQPVQPGRAGDVGPDVPVQPHFVSSMPDRTTSQGQALWAMASPAGRALIGPESSWTNQAGPMTSSGQAQGFYQITTGTWNDFAPRAGVDLRQYPTPMSAPFAVQQQVADAIPLGRWETKDALKRQYPWATDNMTLGQINRFAGGAGTLIEPEQRASSRWGTWDTSWNSGEPGMMPKPDQGIAGMLMKYAVPLLGIASLASGGGLTVALTAYGAMKRAERDGEILPYIQNKQKWEASLAAHTAQQQMESMDAGEAMAAYGGADPSKPAQPEQLRDAMLGIAARYHDQALGTLAQNSDFDGISRLQARRDVLSQPLMKLRMVQAQLQLEELKLQQQIDPNSAVNREREARIKHLEAETEKAKRAVAPDPYLADGTPQGGDTTSAQPDQTDQPDQTEQPAQTGDTGGAPDTGQDTGDTTQQGAATPAQPSPVQTARAAQRLPPPTQLASAGVSDAAVNDPVAQATVAAARQAQPTAQPELGPAMRRLNPAGQEMARQYLEGGEDAIKMVPANTPGRAAIMNAAMELASKLRGIPEDLKGNDVVNAVRRVDPALATTLNNVLRNKKGIPTGSRTASPTTAAFWDRLQNLALQADPSWSPQQFVTLQQTRNDYRPGGQVGKSLVRVFRLNQVAHELWNIAGAMPSGPLPGNVLQQMFESGIAGDPKYAAFATAWHNFGIEAQAVLSGTGNPTVTLSRMMLETLQRGANPAQIRTAIQGDLTAALSAVDANIAGWRQSFPEEGNPGTFDQRSYGELVRLHSGNPMTGDLGPAGPQIGDTREDGKHYIGGDILDERNWR